MFFVNYVFQCSRALRTESAESWVVFMCPLAMRSWFKNTTITVMSSWKWRLTFLSIFLRSEYLISLFLAASWRAAFISLFALPWRQRETTQQDTVQQINLYPEHKESQSNKSYYIQNTSRHSPRNQLYIQNTRRHSLTNQF